MAAPISCAQHFPQVKVVALPKNLGFGGGSNAGFRAAKNDIVVLLNSDMRVDAGFPARRCSKASAIPTVFAVSCQIFFSDPDKLREETGLTQGWWQDGGLRVRHRIDAGDQGPLSVLLRRRRLAARSTGSKFLELGGFDPLLEPFYLEDTDLGYHGVEARLEGAVPAAQRRLSRASRHHRQEVHAKTRSRRCSRRTSCCSAGRTFTSGGGWSRTSSSAWAGAVLGVLFGDVPLRPNLAALWRAFRQLPQAVRSRWRARCLARVSDTEAFRRPLGGYFRDRFDAMRDRRPSGCACCSFRPIRSVRRCTAAASSCTRRCASWRSWPTCTWSSCSTGRAGEGQRGAARVLRVRGVAGAAAERRPGHGVDRCRTPCASSPMATWSG